MRSSVRTAIVVGLVAISASPGCDPGDSEPRPPTPAPVRPGTRSGLAERPASSLAEQRARDAAKDYLVERFKLTRERLTVIAAERQADGDWRVLIDRGANRPGGHGTVIVDDEGAVVRYIGGK